MKFLVKETPYFVDGHGTPDSGNVKKFITDQLIYQYTNPDKFYRSYELEYIKNPYFNNYFNHNKEIIENFFIEEGIVYENTDEMYAQDSYNCKVCKFVVKQITEEKAEEIQYTLEQYNDL